MKGFRNIAGFALVLLVSLCLLLRHPPAIAAPEDEVRLLLNGLKTNLESARSGRGRAIWTLSALQGDFLGVPEGVTRPKRVNFAFDGKKIRFDKTYDPGLRKAADGKLEKLEPLHPPTREAFDGELYYEYIYYPWHEDQNVITPPDAYIRKGTFSVGGELVGHRADIKWLMKPMAASLDELFSIIDSAAVRTVRLADHLVEVELTVPETGEVLKLLFDENQGFNIVQEEFWSGEGVLSYRVDRSFEEHDGVWFIKLFSYETFRPSDAGELQGRIEVRVEDVELNVEIPPNTFNLRGFGLPPHTRVHDMISGVEYTLSPEEAIEKQLDKVLEFHELEVTGVEDQGSERKLPVAEVEPPLTAPEVAVATTAPPSSKRTIYVITGVAALVLLLGLILVALRRKAAIRQKGRARRSEQICALGVCTTLVGLLMASAQEKPLPQIGTIEELRSTIGLSCSEQVWQEYVQVIRYFESKSPYLATPREREYFMESLGCFLEQLEANAPSPLPEPAQELTDAYYRMKRFDFMRALEGYGRYGVPSRTAVAQMEIQAKRLAAAYHDAVNKYFPDLDEDVSEHLFADFSSTLARSVHSGLTPGWTTPMSESALNEQLMDIERKLKQATAELGAEVSSLSQAHRDSRIAQRLMAETLQVRQATVRLTLQRSVSTREAQEIFSAEDFIGGQEALRAYIEASTAGDIRDLEYSRAEAERQQREDAERMKEAVKDAIAEEALAVGDKMIQKTILESVGSAFVSEVEQSAQISDRATHAADRVKGPNQIVSVSELPLPTVQVPRPETAPPSSKRTIYIITGLAALVLLLAAIILALRRKAAVRQKGG